MPEGNPPAQHAQVAEEVERRAERERTRNPPAYPSVEWTASVAPRRPGSALPALPAVSDDESDQISIAYSSTRAAAPAYGSAALKPITAANAAEMRIVPRMKRRRPKTLATVAGASSVQALEVWAATNVRNVTTQPRSADISHVGTQHPTEQASADRVRRTGRKTSKRP